MTPEERLQLLIGSLHWEIAALRGENDRLRRMIEEIEDAAYTESTNEPQQEADE